MGTLMNIQWSMTKVSIDLKKKKNSPPKGLVQQRCVLCRASGG